MNRHADKNLELPSQSNGMALVVLAAGMGSRYGGLKQLDPVGPHGEVLLDYSIHDAVHAGFTEIVFVIRKEIAHVFQEHIQNRYALTYPNLKMSFAFQELTDLPKKISFSRLPSKFADADEGQEVDGAQQRSVQEVLDGASTGTTQHIAATVEFRKKSSVQRSKPWGTGHALLAARHHVTTPFVVINADDYYGPSGYRLLKDFLLQLKLPTSTTVQQHSTYAMVAYALKNTLSEHGSVSRGVCQATSEHFMIDITECTSIRKTPTGILAEEKNGAICLTGEEWVSLNFWGFTPTIFSYLEEGFAEFLECEENHDSAEFYLPSIVNKLVHQKVLSVKLLPTEDPWFGLTHPADLPHVKKALAKISLKK